MGTGELIRFVIISFSALACQNLYAGENWPDLPSPFGKAEIYLDEAEGMDDDVLIELAKKHAHAEVEKGTYTFLTPKGFPKVPKGLRPHKFWGGGCYSPTIDLFYKHIRGAEFKIYDAEIWVPESYTSTYNQIIQRGIHQKYGEGYKAKIKSRAEAELAAYKSRVIPRRRIAYVTDASAASKPHWDAMIGELKRSTSNLKPYHGFTIVYYHDHIVSEVVPGRTRYADKRLIKHAFKPVEQGWIRPKGKADLKSGLLTALRYKPQLIYLMTSDLQSYKAKDLAEMIRQCQKINAKCNVIVWDDKSSKHRAAILADETKGKYKLISKRGILEARLEAAK